VEQNTNFLLVKYVLKWLNVYHIDFCDTYYSHTTNRQNRPFSFELFLLSFVAKQSTEKVPEFLTTII
jgi:hypothetical protein